MQYHPISTLQPMTIIPNQQRQTQAQQLAQSQYNQQSQQQSQQVPFGTLPLTQPGSLSYGFGLSQASNFNTWNTQQSPQPTPPSVSGFGSYRNTSGSGSNSLIGLGSIRQTITPLSNLTTNSPTSASRRRRRSLSVEEDERDYNNSNFDGVYNSGGRNITGGGGGNRILKRVKVLEDVKSPPVGGSSKDLAKEGIDLGKSLASLPKESLLKILTSLVTTSPSLIPTIQSLLPPPTLTQTLLTLATLERTVLQTLPSTNSGTLDHHPRIDYIYGRIRIPLEEYILECKSFLNAFCSPNTILSTTSSSGSGEDEIGHPSTTFSLLHALASSLRRLELALPSPPSPSPPPPLAIHLLPLLINSFHIFITKLSTSVNNEGKILSGSILRNWFERMDGLCVTSPNLDEGRREGAAKKALEGVRDRMRREIGWVVGLREVVQLDVAGDGMEDEEL